MITGLLLRHEGLKLKPYKCTSNKLTIGVGRNLDDNGISKDEAMYMLNNDIHRCIKEVESAFPFFHNLPTARQDCLIDMCFNIGLTRLLGFKRMLKAIEDKDYVLAAMEMRDSKWYNQVTNRANELAYIMEHNKEV